MTAPFKEPGRADAVLAYKLDAADALAWESRSPVHRKRDRLALVASLFAALGLLNLLSGQFENVPGLHSLPAAVGLMALPPLVIGLLLRRDRRRRADLRGGEGVDTRLEFWAERLVEHRADRREPLVRGARSLRAVYATGRHVFLSFGREDVVIVPARAFGSNVAMAEFAAHWRARIG